MAIEVYGRVEFRRFTHESHEDPDDQTNHGPIRTLGHADRHWAPGEGEIHWPEVFRALSECESDPHLVLELRRKSDIPAGIAYLQGLGLAE